MRTRGQGAQFARRQSVHAFYDSLRFQPGIVRAADNGLVDSGAV